jgi:hypothetical protein
LISNTSIDISTLLTKRDENKEENKASESQPPTNAGALSPNVSDEGKELHQVVTSGGSTKIHSEEGVESEESEETESEESESEEDEESSSKVPTTAWTTPEVTNTAWTTPYSFDVVGEVIEES